MKRKILVGVAVLLAVWALWQLVSIFMRSPQQQVLDAQQEFFDAVERRDWDEVKEWMTADYGDELGQDRERAIANAREALKPFFTLEIEDEVTRSLAVKDLGEVNVKMHLKGTGAGYTQLVIDQVNNLKEPWIFHWHKKGRWPWDWKIVQIHNAQLMGMRLPQMMQNP